MQLTVTQEQQHEDGTVVSGEVTFVGEPHEWEWLCTVMPLFAETALVRSVESMCVQHGAVTPDAP
jgi:hypothetical protein